MYWVIVFLIILGFSVQSSFAVSEMEEINLFLSKGSEEVVNGDFEKAIEYFDKALEIEPDNTKALNGKGVVLMNLVRYDDALEYFDKALEIEPDNTNVLNNKGAVLISLERFEEALKYFDKALEIEPDNTNALKNKGMIHHLTRDYNDAILYLDKILQIDPDNADAKLAIKDALKKSPISPVHENGFLGHVQIIVKNAQGKLVTKIISDRSIKMTDNHLVYKFLEKKSEIIVADGQEFEVFKWTSSIKPSVGFYGSRIDHYIDYEDFTFTGFSVIHNGIILKKGDTISTDWIIYRPLN